MNSNHACNAFLQAGANNFANCYCTLLLPPLYSYNIRCATTYCTHDVFVATYLSSFMDLNMKLGVILCKVQVLVHSAWSISNASTRNIP